MLTFTLTSSVFANDLADSTQLSDQRSLKNYMLHCQGCHSPDGSGVDGNVPSMLGQAGNFLHVKGGREFLVQVPGSANAALDDHQLAELLNWMLTTFSPEEIPEGFVPYSTSEVRALRKNPLVEVEAARADLVKKIELLGLEQPKQ